MSLASVCGWGHVSLSLHIHVCGWGHVSSSLPSSLGCVHACQMGHVTHMQGLQGMRRYTRLSTQRPSLPAGSSWWRARSSLLALTTSLSKMESASPQMLWCVRREEGRGGVEMKRRKERDEEFMWVSVSVYLVWWLCGGRARMRSVCCSVLCAGLSAHHILVRTSYAWYICICICLYIHMYICICIRDFLIQSRASAHTHAHTHTHIQTHTHTHT